jgi:hypothetical protein
MSYVIKLQEEYILEMFVIIQFENCCYLVYSVYFQKHWRLGNPE